jgi:ATP-binding cassette subfamily F protein uup
MLAQRGQDLASSKPVAAGKARARRAPAAAPAAPKPGKRRLSFHERHALETLPARIAELQAGVQRLQNRLADPGLYARDRQAFTKATEELGSTQAELAQAEERWLELEILREEIEGA